MSFSEVILFNRMYDEPVFSSKDQHVFSHSLFLLGEVFCGRRVCWIEHVIPDRESKRLLQTGYRDHAAAL